MSETVSHVREYTRLDLYRYVIHLLRNKRIPRMEILVICHLIESPDYRRRTSNAELSTALQSAQLTISTCISYLKFNGVIDIENFDGRKRDLVLKPKGLEDFSREK